MHGRPLMSIVECVHNPSTTLSHSDPLNCVAAARFEDCVKLWSVGITLLAHNIIIIIIIIRKIFNTFHESFIRHVVVQHNNRIKPKENRG